MLLQNSPEAASAELETVDDEVGEGSEHKL